MSQFEPFPEDWSRGLVLMAHPDDPEYGTALAVNRWTRQGKDIAYVLASSGEAGIEGLPPSEAGPLREEEQRRAITHVGVKSLEFLDLPDGRMEYGLALRQHLAAAIRRHRPEVVVTLTFEPVIGGIIRNQADHRAVGLATMDAVSDAGNSWIFPDLPGEPWSGVRHVAVFADSAPTHEVSIEAEDVAAATAALSEHREYLARISDDPIEDQARAQIERVLGDDPNPTVKFRLFR